MPQAGVHHIPTSTSVLDQGRLCCLHNVLYVCPTCDRSMACIVRRLVGSLCCVASAMSCGEDIIPSFVTVLLSL